MLKYTYFSQGILSLHSLMQTCMNTTCLCHRHIKFLSKMQKDYCAVYVGVLVCLYVRDTTLTDQTLICHLFLLRLSLQRGTKPKKVLHVSLTSVSIAMAILNSSAAWHPSNSTLPVCVCVCVCVCMCSSGVFLYCFC